MLNEPPPSLKFLERASDRSLESYELSRLNHANNLRKEIAVLIDQWLEESAAALVARWLLEHRRHLRQARNSRVKSLNPDCSYGRSAELIPAHRRLA